MEQSYLSWHLTSLLQYGACRHKVKKIIFQIQKVHYLDQKVNNAQIIISTHGRIRSCNRIVAIVQIS